MNRLPVVLLIMAAVCPILAQPRVDARNLYERVLCVVPMTGAGTHADPRRPMFAPVPGAPVDARGILAFSFVASDDGRVALVELVARERSAFTAVFASRLAGVVVFEKGKAARADIEREFRKHKRDFTLDDFPGVTAR